MALCFALGKFRHIGIHTSINNRRTGLLCDARSEITPRSDQVDINDDVTYTVNTLNMFKGEPNVRYAQVISFITGGNSAACGVDLEIGEEYLLGISPAVDPFDPDRDGRLSVGACGLVRTWSSITDEEASSLEYGCDGEPCGGSCDEYQVNNLRHRRMTHWGIRGRAAKA